MDNNKRKRTLTPQPITTKLSPKNNYRIEDLIITYLDKNDYNVFKKRNINTIIELFKISKTISLDKTIKYNDKDNILDKNINDHLINITTLLNNSNNIYNVDFTIKDIKYRYIKFLLLILNLSDNIYYDYKDKYFNRINKLNTMKRLLMRMEENAITGLLEFNNKEFSKNFYKYYKDVIKIGDINNDNISGIDLINDYEKNYDDEDYNKYKPFNTISNTLVKNLIEFYIYKINSSNTKYNTKIVKKTDGGKKIEGGKIYTGPKGGKYTIKIIDGKKVKKYIKQ